MLYPHIYLNILYYIWVSIPRRLWQWYRNHRISGIRKIAPYQPPGGHQANYSALRRCVTSHATVLSCRSPIGWRWRIPAGLSGRNPKFNRHLANAPPVRGLTSLPTSATYIFASCRWPLDSRKSDSNRTVRVHGGSTLRQDCHVTGTRSESAV